MNVRDDDGQVLVLTLAFLLFASLVIGAILSFATSSELSTVQLGLQRNAVYAADGATDAAIQVGRVDKTVGGYGDARCRSTVPATPVTPVFLTTTSQDGSKNGTVAKVICTWSADPLQPERTVTYTTFVAGLNTPVVQAQVLYHDSMAGSGDAPVYVINWTYCGHGATC
jgi:hypothetical protein